MTTRMGILPPMTFSQRMGYKPLKTAVQLDTMDDDLKVAIWNALLKSVFRQPHIRLVRESTDSEITSFKIVARVFEAIWEEYWKRGRDELPRMYSNVEGHTKGYIMRGQWYEVYDLLEAVASNCSPLEEAELLHAEINKALERELSGYRLVGGVVTPITNVEELNEVDNAISQTDVQATVGAHLRRALAQFSDRESPDYRNSIKESISAVEAMCFGILGRKFPDLPAALQDMEKRGKLGFHPALRAGFEKIYGWTSDADGIRHGLMDAPIVGAAEARYMLVTCSAFVNLMQALARPLVDS